MVNRGSIGKRIRHGIGARIQRSAITAAQTAETAAQNAKQSAMQGLDQFLLGLQHKKIACLIDPQDLVQSLGRKILERADAIRAQLAEKPISPSWLRDVSLSRRPVSFETTATDIADVALPRVVIKQKKVKAASPRKATNGGARPKKSSTTKSKTSDRKTKAAKRPK